MAMQNLHFSPVISKKKYEKGDEKGEKKKEKNEANKLRLLQQVQSINQFIHPSYGYVEHRI